jgi:hypothetical protein
VLGRRIPGQARRQCSHVSGIESFITELVAAFLLSRQDYLI